MAHPLMPDGGDVGNVFIPVTGVVAYRRSYPITDDQINSLLAGTFPSALYPLGLLQKDGGYSEEYDAGERETFFQRGYSIQTGEADITFTVICKESNNYTMYQTGLTEPFGAAQSALNGVNTRGYMPNLPTWGVVLTLGKNNKLSVKYGRMSQVNYSINYAESGSIYSVEVTFKWVKEDGVFYKEVFADADGTATASVNRMLDNMHVSFDEQEGDGGQPLTVFEETQPSEVNEPQDELSDDVQPDVNTPQDEVNNTEIETVVEGGL